METTTQSGATYLPLADMTVPIYTIGYGTLSTDQFLAALRPYKIQFLIDVRSRPYSRFRPEFSRESIKAVLQKARVRYVYMGDLLGGQPEDPQCYDSEGRVDYAVFQATQSYQHGISRLRTAHTKSLLVCLMCSEEQPENCHRSKLIGHSLEATEIEVRHILPNGDWLSQDAVIHRVTGGQASMFGLTLKSRKSYRGPGQ